MSNFCFLKGISDVETYYFFRSAPNGPANLSQKLSDDGKKNSKTKKKSNSKG